MLLGQNRNIFVDNVTVEGIPKNVLTCIAQKEGNSFHYFGLLQQNTCNEVLFLTQFFKIYVQFIYLDFNPKV
jgi:hypothetical protein